MNDFRQFNRDRNRNRRRPPHFPPKERLNQSRLVFVTVCAKDRKPILGSQNVHKLLRQTWLKAEAWLVGRYVILPDHIHLFCAPATEPSVPLADWIRFWKSQASMAWPDQNQHPVWQRDFWDTQLRQGESYHGKWNYVRLNPVRHRLATNAADWPFQGEIHPLIWHEKI